MIYTTLKNIEQYYGISENLKKGLRFLAETDFSTMEDGRYEIDGDKLYFLLLHYDTKVENNTPEAHKKYIDIQYMIEGEELIGVGPLADMTGVVEEKPENDIWFYNGPQDYLLLRDDRLTVLFPDDAHAPGIAVDEPVNIRKCVVKVLV
ncbi:MAG: YhcH/YjgK/YiaL family protein [Oscillospiraceae bacterium]|nr:YhcH/YjgK/YiaL family protein [Oscillospiraceae bacterium]